MMSATVKKLITWLCIATLSLVAVVGEGLHCIPGCGHGTEVGERVLLLGISLPEPKQPGDDRPGVECPEGQGIPIYDEDECAICSAVGQSCRSADCPEFVFVMPFVDVLPAVVLCDVPAATVRLFQVRAPPRV
jgi:hypothetical protein